MKIDAKHPFQIFIISTSGSRWGRSTTNWAMGRYSGIDKG